MGHRIEFIFFQLLKTIVLALPLKSAQRLGAALGNGAYFLMASRRRIAMENLRYAFPDKPESELAQIAKGSFRNFAIAFIELLWFPNMTPAILDRLIDFESNPFLDQVKKKEESYIMLTGHYGNWELTGLGGSYYLQRRFIMIVKTQKNRLVDTVINRHRCSMGNLVISQEVSVRETLRALAENEIVAIAADQTAPKESLQVEFFGRKVATYEGPALFSIRTGAPLFFLFAVRQPDFTYKVEFEQVPMQDLPEDKAERVRELTYRHTAILEKHIRLHPDHWLWLHRRWKHWKAPSGDEPA